MSERSDPRANATSDLSFPRADFNACGTEFLLRELQLARTFMDLAAVSASPEHAHRARLRAARAHQTVLRFLPNVRPEPREKQIIQGHLARLESRMKIAGLSVDTTIST
jgi:hypothetical protein